MFLGYVHTHTCNHPSRELNVVSLQQYCFAANCKPQCLGKSCPAPSMFLWFPESAYRCPGARCQPRQHPHGRPQAPVLFPQSFDCFWLSRHTEWSLQSSKLGAGHRKAAKKALFLFILHLLWAHWKCHGCSPGCAKSLLEQILPLCILSSVSQDKPQVHGDGARTDARRHLWAQNYCSLSP